MFSYILFDLDNTIYSYTDAHEIAINSVLDNMSSFFKIDKKELEKNYTNEKGKYQLCCYRQASSHNKFIQIKKLFEKYSLDLNKVNYYYEIYKEIFNNEIRLYSNVLDFIKFCKSRNIKMYILTNNTCYDQLERLQKMNIIQYFEKIYTSEEFGVEKPDIKLFYYILTDIGCNKDEIVKIGDNYSSDIEPLCMNNIYSFWFNKNVFSIKKKYLEFNYYGDLLNFFEEYYNNLEKFLDISSYVGERFDLVQAGGGNTSFKMDDLMFVKSSGCCLSNLGVNSNYVGVNYFEIKKKIENINFEENENNDKKYRELKCKELVDNNIIFLKKYKPSIETTLHCLTKKYTVHIHPIQFNVISGSPDCVSILNKIFKNDIEKYCVIDYFTPGIEVSLELLKKYENEKVIFLKNHGLVFTSDTIENLRKIIDKTINILEKNLNLDFCRYHIVNDISQNLKEILKEKKITYLSENELINKCINSGNNFDNLFRGFFPDKIVYCGISYCMIDRDTIKKQIVGYIEKFKEIPKIYIFKSGKYYLYISANSINKCREIEEVIASHLMCYNDSNILLDDKEVLYLNNWEAEKYRKSIQ
tara:strand:- start:946 stop:2700 length:1755 start_codon:yes stop_codon:yes gene_type:complete